jgi:hypothetical protein
MLDTQPPFLWHWGVLPILDTQLSLMTIKCHSYTWHSAQSYVNEVSFLYLTHSPVLWQWSVIPMLDTQPPFLWHWGVLPILDTQLSLMTMKCHSYTWHSAQSYVNEVSFLYLTHSPVLWQWSVIPIPDTQPPVLWQWGVIPILDTQPSLMSMMCHSYTWHSAHSHDNEVSFLYLTLSPILMTWQWVVIAILDTQSSLNTCACKIWRHLVLRNIKVLKKNESLSVRVHVKLWTPTIPIDHIVFFCTRFNLVWNGFHLCKLVSTWWFFYFIYWLLRESFGFISSMFIFGPIWSIDHYQNQK